MGDSDCQSNTWIINSNDMGGNNGGTTIMQCYMVSKVIQSIIHEKLHDTDFLLLSNSFTHFWTLTMTDIAYVMQPPYTFASVHLLRSYRHFRILYLLLVYFTSALSAINLLEIMNFILLFNMIV